MHFQFVPSEDFGVNLVRMTPDGDLHAHRNMALCNAMDMTKLSIILAEMAETGHISRHQAQILHVQASALLSALLTENNRSFIGSKKQSTASEIRRYGVEAISAKFADKNGDRT